MLFEKTIELNRMDGLYLRYLANKGRGLFCRNDIKAGAIIETTPSFLFVNDFTRGTVLQDYVFTSCDVPKSIRKLIKVKEKDTLVTLPLGVSLICNHSKDNNATYKQTTNLHSVFFQLIALRDIPKNTEICINYGDHWFTLRNFYGQK